MDWTPYSSRVLYVRPGEWSSRRRYRERERDWKSEIVQPSIFGNGSVGVWSSGGDSLHHGKYGTRWDVCRTMCTMPPVYATVEHLYCYAIPVPPSLPQFLHMINKKKKFNSSSSAVDQQQHNTALYLWSFPSLFFRFSTVFHTKKTNQRNSAQ